MTKTGMPENELKTLAELHKEASEIQLKIRRLLLQNYSFDDGIADQLTKISVISDLRQKFIAIEKEIRLRTERSERNQPRPSLRRRPRIGVMRDRWAKRRYVPHFIALAASSPYHQGTDTAFDSARLNSIAAFPLSGRAPVVARWSGFVEYFEAMRDYGIVDSMKELTEQSSKVVGEILVMAQQETGIADTVYDEGLVGSVARGFAVEVKSD